MLTSGKGNKEIDTLLDIGKATVKVHITHILEKLQVTGRTGAWCIWIHSRSREGNTAQFAIQASLKVVGHCTKLD